MPERKRLTLSPTQEEVMHLLAQRCQIVYRPRDLSFIDNQRGFSYLMRAAPIRKSTIAALVHQGVVKDSRRTGYGEGNKVLVAV